MYLEGQPVPLTGIDTGECGFPCTRHTAEAIVLLGIERIDTDAHAHHADIHKRSGHVVINQHPICSKDDHEAELHSVARDIKTVSYTHLRAHETGRNLV